MGKTKRRPVLIGPDVLIMGNGRVTELDRVLRDSNVQRAYSRLLKRLDATPENIGEKLREERWKGKSLEEILAILGE